MLTARRTDAAERDLRDIAFYVACNNHPQAADRIIVLENGQIIEEGNHDGLLSSGGHYAGFYNTYFRHQSLEYIESAKNMVA